MGYLTVSFDVAVRSVVRQVTNWCLSPLSSPSCSSQKSIWNILTSIDCSWNDRLLWLHFSMLLTHINSEIKGSLVGKTTLSLDNLGSIFYGQNRSWLNWASSNFLSWLMSDGSWLSANICLMLFSWISPLLVVWSTWSLSLGLDFLCCSLLCQSLLVGLRKILTGTICLSLHVTNITLWDLHLLRWWSVLSVLTFLVGRQFLVWSHTDLLIDLDWTMTNSEPCSKSSIWLRDNIAFLLEAWIYLQVELVGWLVCGRWWHSCCNVHIIDRLFQFFKVRSLWWLFSGGLAFDASSNCLRVTLDNHWLERKDFLFVSSLIYVRWWWYNIAEFIVSCLLRKLVCRNILAILHSCRPFLVWKIGILLFIRKGSMNLILLNNFLELFSIDALSLVVTKDHCLGNFLVLWIFFLEELFNTVTIDVELFLITSFLVARDYWVKVKNVLVRGLQIWKQIVHIHTCWLVWAILSLVGLTTWR